eukprot:CAMPEP_0195040210 /NCGR_PEP_ID=MMETSP0326_2-20130528/80209_1 /TAXON_ID=2866 ORGANISM="Crypthecodinium cohnii, Strain Seligo" /NCGR_SAMPLE_ID=MMETSP0326_2 /ASSEMBLY_ACC=CAM_ASM_000348 /LENGTH=187 /DNA_ID=CAMNT_0040067109 /DNA_START=136 /DNA_END=696 /DNA_ORIENTATION=-
MEVAALSIEVCSEGSMLTFAGVPLVEGKVGDLEIEEGSTLMEVPRLMGGGDGTPAMGKRHKKSHTLCRRCPVTPPIFSNFWRVSKTKIADRSSNAAAKTSLQLIIMQLFCRTLNGSTAALEVQPEMDVSELVCSEGAMLTFAGVPLVEGTVGDLAIQEGSTLMEVPRLAGGGDGPPAMGKRHKKSHT